MIVLDASCVLELLLGSRLGAQVAQRIQDQACVLHAPELLDLEVAQVLRRLVRSKVLSEERAHDALVDLCDLDLVRHPHLLLLPRVWELRGNLTAYDAAYVALAELLGAPLLTSDAKLASAPGIEVALVQ